MEGTLFFSHTSILSSPFSNQRANRPTAHQVRPTPGQTCRDNGKSPKATTFPKPRAPNSFDAQSAPISFQDCVYRFSLSECSHGSKSTAIQRASKSLKVQQLCPCHQQVFDRNGMPDKMLKMELHPAGAFVLVNRQLLTPSWFLQVCHQRSLVLQALPGCNPKRLHQQDSKHSIGCQEVVANRAVRTGFLPLGPHCYVNPVKTSVTLA